MALLQKQPNIGSEKTMWVMCPNCSRMHEALDMEGKAVTIPEQCKRCGCPMDTSIDGRVAHAWMDAEAEKASDPAVTRFGRLMRGESDRMVRSASNKGGEAVEA